MDLLSFNLFLDLADVSIGAKEHPLTHSIYSAGDGNWSTQYGTTSSSVSNIIDSFTASLVWMSGNEATCSPTQPPMIRIWYGNSAEFFQGCITFTPTDPTGDSLSFNSTTGIYTYTKKDGTLITFNGLPTSSNNGFLPEQVTFPDGRVLTYWYYNDGTAAPTLKSITSSDGLQIKYTYAQLSSGAYALASVTAINNAYEYCSPTADTCALSMTWPTVTYAWTSTSAMGGILTVTDSQGRVTRYTEDTSGRTVGLKLPSSASADNIIYAYCTSTTCPAFATEGQYGVPYQNYVLSVTRDGQLWKYSGNPGSTSPTKCGTATYGFTNPVGSGKQVQVVDCLPNTESTPLYPSNPFIQLTNETGVEFISGAYGLIKSVVQPESNQIKYLWDTRSNITQETKVPKPSSSLAQVILTENYDSTCTIQVKCNQPNWVKDGLLNETDYTYDPTHGGVLTVTSPAVAIGFNSVRPQIRYTYTQLYASILNASGSYVQSAAPIWVLSTESYCRTSAASTTSGTGCVLAGDQVVKTYEYGSASGPSNLFVKGFNVTADGVTVRTCYGYDAIGNRTSETQPDAQLTSCP